MASVLPAFYEAARAHLWVEDPTTRDYLSALWPDLALQILPAGGIRGVQAMVKAAEDNRILPGRVFGLADRDHGRDNEAEWENPSWQGLIYRPNALEIENFMLDEISIAEAPSNAIGIDPQTLQEKLVVYAQQRSWWMSCKRVLATLNEQRNTNFPSDKLGNKVDSEDKAVELLLGCEWAKGTLPDTCTLWTESELRRRVQDAHSMVCGWLKTDEWRSQFSGKELFRWVAGQITSGPGITRPATAHDLAMEVGSIQARKGREPDPLRRLRASIRRRAGV